MIGAMILALLGPASGWGDAADAGQPQQMPGMTMPMPPQPARVAEDPSCSPEHARMGHCVPRAAPPQEAPAAPAPAGTDLPAGNAPAPAAPQPKYADRFWDHDAMTRARNQMRKEHGGVTLSQMMLNIAEVQPRGGADGYRWDGDAWFGGDVDRLVVKGEGEGRFGRRADTAEVQALYSRAIGPYFNLQGGVRQDLAAGSRTYAVAAIEGLAPYWFDVQGALFLSDHGDLLARAEAYYDQRITQRLVLQPRLEVNLSAQDIPASRIGSGLVDAEFGLRLRYEVARKFAPYVGVSWERRFSASRRLARLAGEDTGGVTMALGLRGWF
ncbi:copper resistance protein B [Sphingomonas gellani]|uniref:Copper resistance protein B n=1 Tax=Sphingomonas gellani TaxID=1166340 RepID=A0A1H8H7Q3_9SPHN|nr:copper resistance protein B [Sphingomonas gellani]SEN52273.1 copper resistance protein B [Sphingomonas gellani]